MKKYLPIFFVACLASCRQSNLDEQITSISNSLISSNKLIADNNSRNYDYLLKRLTQFWSPVSLDNWDTVLHTIHGMSTGMLQHIDSLSQQVQATGNNNEQEEASLLDKQMDNLHHQLQAYYQSVLQAPEPAIASAHPNVQNSMRKELGQARKNSYEQSRQTDDLKKLTLPQVLVILNKFKADVLITELNLLEYCNKYIPYSGRPCNQFAAIAVVNSSYVKPGQPMQAFAGFGTFSFASKPCVMINGQRVNLQADGTAFFKCIASGKSGVYTIPVCIEHYKPDGSYNIFNKKLEYIIAQ